MLYKGIPVTFRSAFFMLKKQKRKFNGYGRKGEQTMSTYERILHKLTVHLEELGFRKSQDEYKKTLKTSSDFRITKHHYDAISSGNAYGGNRDYLFFFAEENYISDIEESFEDVLSLTENEKKWLRTYDEDGCLGWDLISDWIWEHVSVSIQRKAFNAFIKTLAA